MALAGMLATPVLRVTPVILATTVLVAMEAQAVLAVTPASAGLAELHTALAHLMLLEVRAATPAALRVRHQPLAFSVVLRVAQVDRRVVVMAVQAQLGAVLAAATVAVVAVAAEPV